MSGEGEEQSPGRVGKPEREPAIPSDPVTRRYPLLAHLEGEDDATRIDAFKKVLEEVRAELKSLTDEPPDGQRQKPGER